MRVKITKRPAAGEFEEYDLRQLIVGEEFEAPVRLGTLLLWMGYAELPANRAEAADRGPARPRRSKPVTPKPARSGGGRKES